MGRVGHLLEAPVMVWEEVADCKAMGSRQEGRRALLVFKRLGSGKAVLVVHGSSGAKPPGFSVIIGDPGGPGRTLHTSTLTAVFEPSISII